MCLYIGPASAYVWQYAQRPGGRQVVVIGTVVLGWHLAATASEAAPSARVVVVVSSLPDHDFDERVVVAVLAHARARGLEIEVRRPGEMPAPAVLARDGHALVLRWGARGAVWIALAADGATMLYLAEPTRDRVYRRTLPAAGAGSARAESVANVVSAVIAAIHEGQLAAGPPPAGLDIVDPTSEVPNPGSRPGPPPIGVVEPERGPGSPPAAVVEPAPPARAPAPPRLRAPDPPAWPRLRLGLGYTGSTFAAALPWQSGLALAAGWRPASRVHLDLGYEVVFGSTVRSEVIDLSLRRHPIYAAGGYTWPVGARFDLRLGGRLAVDVVARRAVRAAQGVSLSEDRRRLFVGAGVLVGAGVRPTPAVRIGLSVGAEVIFNRSDYVVHTPAPVVILAPLPVRFLAAVTLELEGLRRRRVGEKK